MKRAVFGLTALAAGALLIVSQGVSQPPGGKEGKGPPDRGGPPRFELGQLLPPPLVEELKLTAEQKKELDAIQKDVKARLDKLLTAEQKKMVESFRPRGGPGGPGGRGGPDGGGRPPRDGKGGDDRPDRPPVEKEKPPAE